jgi:hypothetical protein
MAEEIKITEEVKKVEVKKPNRGKEYYVVYFLGGVVEILLLFRFVFKMTGADPASGFVSFIYAATNFLVAPYAGFVFEPGTLIAMAVYAILAWGIAKIIVIAVGRSHNVQ